jgi:uncharacterized protein (DUF1499 family)
MCVRACSPSVRFLVVVVFCALSIIVAIAEYAVAARHSFAAGVVSALSLVALSIVRVASLSSPETDAKPLQKWAVRALCGATIGVFAWCVLLLGVAAATPSRLYAAFPDACQPGDKPNCVRLVPGSSKNNGNLTAPAFANATCDALLLATRRFALDQNAQIDTATSDFVQATFVTRAFGFVDDFCVACNTSAASVATLSVQSESRLGYADFGANLARVSSFLRYLNATQQ